MTTFAKSLARTRLAAALAAACGLAAPAAWAATQTVANCNNSGTGSLRQTIAVAAPGDTVDLSHLTTASPGCSASAISLTTGAIAMTQDDLTIVGSSVASPFQPGFPNVVNADYGTTTHAGDNRIFEHVGIGTLTIENLAMGQGSILSANSDALGGCIYSNGNVHLLHSSVTRCKAQALDTGSAHSANGGGIYAQGSVTVENSLVQQTHVGTNAGVSGKARGGGVFARGDLSVKYGTLINNVAGQSDGMPGYGGGAFARGSVTLMDATIGGNIASHTGGALFAADGTSALLVQDTIWNNYAANVGGAYLKTTDSIGVYNSTIASNAAATVSSSLAAGLALHASGSSPASVTLVSNLISNNASFSYTSPPVAADVSAVGVTITGNHNLIYAPNGNGLPPDTIAGKCPLLESTQFFEPTTGMVETWVIPLGSHSLAIDHGSNPKGIDFDQRGTPYARVVGTAADIGAYEFPVASSDEIFGSGFDEQACP